MTKKQRILQKLIAGWNDPDNENSIVSNRELNEIAFRYGDIIFKMRQDDIEIETVFTSGNKGLVYYALKTQPGNIDLQTCTLKKELSIL